MCLIALRTKIVHRTFFILRSGWGGWIARDKSLVLTLFGPPLASAHSIRDRTLVLIAHPQAIKKAPINGTFFIGWGGWIRTNEWRNQNPLPYHLATPQSTAIKAYFCLKINLFLKVRLKRAYIFLIIFCIKVEKG